MAFHFSFPYLGLFDFSSRLARNASGPNAINLTSTSPDVALSSIGLALARHAPATSPVRCCCENGQLQPPTAACLDVDFFSLMGFPPYFQHLDTSAPSSTWKVFVHSNSFLPFSVPSLCKSAGSFLRFVVHHIPCFSVFYLSYMYVAKCKSRRWSVFCYHVQSRVPNGKGFALAVHVAEEQETSIDAVIS